MPMLMLKHRGASTDGAVGAPDAAAEPDAAGVPAWRLRGVEGRKRVYDASYARP